MTDYTDEELALEGLKAKADTLGIKYHSSIGYDKLAAKIEEYQGGDEPDVAADTPDAPEVAQAIKTSDGRQLKPKKETKAEKQNRLSKEANKLVRVRITCMNPMKKEWTGEIFTVSNSVVGNIKKYVPFDAPWHVPDMILNMMRERQYQSFFTYTDKRTGNKTRKGRLVNEFAIEVLPALTESELKALAQRQAMANGTSEA